jgi:glycosyltransferase involved in cell wall biosynthesis
MRVLNVNSSIDFKTGGGMAERTFQMSRSLANAGAKCTVLTIDTGHDTARAEALDPAALIALPLLWRRFYVPRMTWSLIKKLVDEADIVHLMGHWGFLNAVVYLAARRAGKPYVVCPAGSLPLFGRSRWLKKVYNLLIGRAIIRQASGWIAVTKDEASQFQSYGIQTSQVTVIANGVCEEDFPVIDVEAFRIKYQLPDAHVILFMGRLNAIKGPDLLLNAFALMLNHIEGYHLVFAGPNEGMQADLMKLASDAGLSHRVHFLGFVAGAEKTAAYRLARLLVVPSRQEAMSIVALEAGVCGTPVMLTDQCGFSAIRDIDPNLEVPATVQGISEGLVHILSHPDLLNRAATNFRTWILERYTWSSMVPEYLNLYQEILNKVKNQ